MATFLELGNYGRTGNMLFQIATTIGYSKKYNVPYVFPKCDIQSLINIPEYSFVDKGAILVDNYYQEEKYSYTDIPFQENCSLSGYFQSWRYFDHCKDYIKKSFLQPKIDELKDYCCIHVRRGDYLKFPEHHPTQTLKYYKEAMSKVPTNKFIIFSDDTNWCKQHFIGKEFIINETSADDFKMMGSCSHFIIANSSFSWWAAWLGRDDKVVVAPKNWFGPKLIDNDISDLIPKDWIVI
jgi:hypothetical protein